VLESNERQWFRVIIRQKLAWLRPALSARI